MMIHVSHSDLQLKACFLLESINLNYFELTTYINNYWTHFQGIKHLRVWQRTREQVELSMPAWISFFACLQVFIFRYWSQCQILFSTMLLLNNQMIFHLSLSKAVSGPKQIQTDRGGRHKWSRWRRLCAHRFRLFYIYIRKASRNRKNVKKVSWKRRNVKSVKK